MRRRLICKRNFGNTVDITDPCYDRDVWCRMNNVPIKSGEYYCIKWLNTEKGEFDGKPYEDTMVGILGIYLDGVIPQQKQMVEIGSIGVDAGLAGFFENKPDYNDNEWREFCDRLGKNKNAWETECGVYSSSGYGDGYYGVYAYKNPSNDIVALEIRFM